MTDDRRSMCRPSKIDGRCVDLRRSMVEDRWSKIDGRISMQRSMVEYRFDDRCVDLRRSMVDGRRSMCRPSEIDTITRNATALGSLIRPRAVTRCNLAVSDIYMRDFGKTQQIAYTYCSVGTSDLKPLTGTSADQLPHRKSRSLATA